MMDVTIVNFNANINVPTVFLAYAKNAAILDGILIQMDGFVKKDVGIN